MAAFDSALDRSSLAVRIRADSLWIEGHRQSRCKMFLDTPDIDTIR